MEQIEQVLGRGNEEDDEHNLVSVEEELDILRLDNDSFADGIASLIKHMLDKKDMRHNEGGGSGGFAPSTSTGVAAPNIYSSIDFE